MTAEKEGVIRDLVEESLGTRVRDVIPTQLRSGQICKGIGLITDCGKVFVKILKICHPMGQALFTGESESLKLIEETKTLRVPKPLKVTTPKENLDSVLILEYLEMASITPDCGALLGEQLARMHLDNHKKLSQRQGCEGFVHSQSDNLGCVDQYGFHIPTYNGSLLQDNTWQSDWETFFVRNKLQPQIDLVQSQYSDREAADLWPVVLQKIQSSHCLCTDIKPSLVHGDFHGGNIAQTNGQPVVFDPSCLYGHHEFDISIAAMFGSIPQSFWDQYHEIIPRAEGFESRKTLYDLHIHLGHWNHFGPNRYMNWKEESLKLMRKIVKEWD